MKVVISITKTSVFYDMGKHNIDLTGQQIGYLTIIERIPPPTGRQNGRIYWRTKCICGTEKITTNWAIRIQGDHISCGCKKYNKGQPKNRKYTNPQDASYNSVINSYKQRCKRDNIKWLLDRYKAINLFTSNCYYCGIEPLTKKNHNRKLSQEQEWQINATISINGIDRINSNKDYTDDNVVPCCKICNYAKRDLDPEIFTKWLQRIKALPNGKTCCTRM